MSQSKRSGPRKRWVVKVGSNMVSDGGAVLMRSWMQQVLALKRKHNIEVIWVSSGAISSAVNRIDFGKTKAQWKLHEKQALSALGQPILMDLYNLALQSTGLLGAQVLLTNDDLAHKDRRRNLQATLEKLLEWGIVPVLNENDAVATEEIKFGDNDILSAKVAVAMGAHRLVILTDVDGFYDGDPRKNKMVQLMPRVRKVTTKLLRAAGDKSGSKHGTGGMFSKVRAAREATSRHVETVLVKGDVPSVLLRLAEGYCTGTTFEAQ